MVCVYTHDFADLADVKRGECVFFSLPGNWAHRSADEMWEEVLLNMQKLGLGTKRSISYKPGELISPRKRWKANRNGKKYIRTLGYTRIPTFTL